MKQNGHTLVDPLLAFGAMQKGGSSSEMAAADAQAALADALVRSSVQLNSRAGREIAFLYMYLGPDRASAFVDGVIMKYRPHQSPGTLRKMVDAIKALSLSEFMRGVNLNLGK